MPNIINQVLLNRYRVDAFLASGGMGAVYRVWDRERNVPLAMKVLHSDLAEDPHMFKRFQREANALKKLSHPNIVPFYGMFQTSTFVFLLEGFVDGPTLKDILQAQGGKPLPIEEMLTYLKALSSALGYAHSREVIHCDVKPGNILIDQGGHVYLTDFGIARHADSTTTTMLGAGTAAYMAPEQILEQPLSPATDVYSLGVMLFEMVTGQRPFRGNEAGTGASGEAANVRIRHAHVHLPPPDPRSIQPKISAALANVILKSLDKLPEHRYRTAAELFLATCEATGFTPESVRDRSPGGTGRKREDDSRIKPPRFIVALIAGVLVIGIVAVCGTAARALINRPTPTRTPSTSLPLTDTATRISDTRTPTSDTKPGPTSSPIATEIPATIKVGDAEMVLIPAGPFLMGDSLAQAQAECQTLFPTTSSQNCKDDFFIDETPPHTVNLAAYYIDKYEVSNALYKACVEAGICTAPKPPETEKNPAFYYELNGYEKYPVNWVDWSMAQKYCKWRGTRLPTEAEWEKAARGDSESSQIYPWGNTFDGARANSCDRNCQKAYANQEFNDGYADLAPVDAFPAGSSAYNVFNLAGNVAEWVADWYSATAYSQSTPPGPESGQYVVRGGSWLRFPINLRLVTRDSQVPSYKASDLGFRCAMSVP